jgi:2-polyprenyl-3-methyl-5-hydroxy-6-metoxy-1,4-benzoquinol methylase
MMSEANEAAQYSGELFDLWDTYQKVVVNDYMSHRALGDGIRRALTTHFPERGFSILDLGCGDASVFGPILQSFAPASYKGVDLSETALALAASNLTSLSCPFELAHEDMLSALADGKTYDVIYSSFVLHHLPTSDKAEFFRRAEQSLAPNGLLLLIDAVREEGETLPIYLKNYCDWVRGAWDCLSAAEKDAVYDHLVNNDRPETASVLEAQALAAGLTLVAGGAKYGWHHLMCFARN